MSELMSSILLLLAPQICCFSQISGSQHYQRAWNSAHPIHVSCRLYPVTGILASFLKYDDPSFAVPFYPEYLPLEVQSQPSLVQNDWSTVLVNQLNHRFVCRSMPACYDPLAVSHTNIPFRISTLFLASSTKM